jgi:hypothetical protein
MGWVYIKLHIKLSITHKIYKKWLSCVIGKYLDYNSIIILRNIR